VLLSEGYEDDMERWVSSKFRLKIPFWSTMLKIGIPETNMDALPLNSF
jgi:hypothetical protein